MAQGRLSPFTKIPQRQPVSEPASSQGAMSGSGNPAAQDVSQQVRHGLGMAQSVVSKTKRGFDALSQPQSFNRGSSENAYQAQRFGERDSSPYSISPDTASSGGIWDAMPQDVSTAWQNYSPSMSPRNNQTPPGVSANTNEEGVPIGDPTELGTSAPGLGGALEGSGSEWISSGLGTAGAGLAGAGGLLSIINGLRSGNASSTVGGFGSLYGAASSLAPDTFPSLTGLAGDAIGSIPWGVEGGTVGSTLAESGLAGAGAGLGAVAGTALSGLLIDSLFGGHASISDLWTGGKKSDYASFGTHLAENESQQGRALQILSQALPYARTKEELGQILNEYRNYAGTTQKAPLNTPSGVYNLTTIPGASGFEHGGHGAGAVDWGNATTAFQRYIDAARARLPGTDLTDMTSRLSLGHPPSGAWGDVNSDSMRLWQQFLERDRTAPVWQPTDYQTVINPGSEYEYTTRVLPSGWVGSGQLNEFGGNTGALGYGDPGYDYAQAGWPEPGKYVGTPSGFSGLPTHGSANNLLGTLGFAGLSGPATEIDKRDNPNQV